MRVQSLPDIRCATPRAVRHRPLVSLNDNEFVETTWTPPPPPTSTSTTTTVTTTTTSATTTTVKKRKQPEMRASSTHVGHKSTASPLYPADDSVETKTSSERRPSSPRTSINSRSTPSSDGRQSSSTSRHRGAGHRTHAHHVKHTDEHADDELLGTFKVRLIVAAVTVGATLVIAAIIVAAIVTLWRHSRRPPAKSSTPPPPSVSAAAYDDDDTLTNGMATPRTFIKYKNKNGVLLFSTPVADSPSSLTTTAAGDATPDSCLIGETDADGNGSIRYVLPPSSATGYKTRVYRWEDF